MHDTHAHLELLLDKLDLIKNFDRGFDFDNPDLNLDYSYKEEALKNLLKNHEFVIQATVSAKNFVLSHKLFNKFDNVFFLIGSHPEIINAKFDLEEYKTQEKKLLEPFFENLKTNRIIGVGEIGLDYFYTQDNFEKKLQRDLFEHEIQLALDFGLPIQIHTRDAWEDTFAIIKNFPKIKNRFLVHCFTGKISELERIINSGGIVGYNGIITFKNAKDLQETVKACPLEKFVLETDLPFLAPMPNRGKVCLPEYINDTAKHFGQLKNLTVDQVWKLSKENTSKIYNF